MTCSTFVQSAAAAMLVGACALAGCTAGAPEETATDDSRDGGTAGDAGNDAQIPESLRIICGNGVRESGEDCDLGAQATSSTYCSQRCVTRDLLAPSLSVDGGSFARALGAGRHPIASTANGFAIAMIEGATLVVRVYDTNGLATGSVVVDAAVADAADPSLAALPNGDYVVVWTDRAIDERDVAMAMVNPSTLGLVGAITHANAVTNAAQYDADVVVINGHAIVAWTDTSDAALGPDVRYRVFDAATLAPIAGDQTLAATSAVEGSVALTVVGSAWAAAWRDGQVDGERLRAQFGTTQWTVGPFNGGAAGDRPALVALDATHLLALYDEGTDPTDSGVASTSGVRGVVLDANAPATVAPFWLSVGTTSRDEPAATMINGAAYVAWHSGAQAGDVHGEELWLQTLAWNGTTLDTSAASMTLPRWSQHRAGDQRIPALASATFAGGAAVAAWSDLGKGFGAGEGQGDVVFEVAPIPIVRADGSPDDPACSSGQRYCGGACTSTSSDVSNCGNCGTTCDPVPNTTVTCSAGACAYACGAGTHSCAGQCVANNATATCGASCTPCPVPANAQSTCDGTSCGFACNAGYHLCGGTCVRNDSVGSCGQSCSACAAPGNGQATCDGTSCGATCNGGYHACGGACASNTATSTCGASCTPCAPPANGTATCDGTSCGFSCTSGHHACGGACADNTSVTTCGSSCTPCAAPANATATCNGTSCGFACTSGHHACGSACADNTSASTCGSSCTPCSAPTNATATCNGTSCGFACNGGFHACGGACAGNTSTSTCGSSCTPCVPPANAAATCDGTSCGFSCSSGYHACGGACASNSAVTTCGSSCTPCAVPANGAAACNGGVCAIACNTGFAACNGQCLDATQPSLNPCLVTEANGVFVSSSLGSAAGLGTRASPFPNLSYAVTHSGGKPVFACAETYTESITLVSGVSMYGYFNCAGGVWSVGTSRATINAPTSPAITATTITTATRFEGFNVYAPNAVAPSTSSIGLFANNATPLLIVNARIQAGNGAPGADGTVPSLVQAGTLNGSTSGFAFSNCLTAGGQAADPSLNGGNGGSGGAGGQRERVCEGPHGTCFWDVTPPSNGADGVGIGHGLGGKVGGAAATSGTDGTAGAVGASSSATMGVFNGTSGYQPTNSGLAGTNGHPGSGGGGAAGGPVVGVRAGDTGIGGGAGGCAGLGALGAQGGGASVAVLAFFSSMTMQNVDLYAGNGGTGGRGVFGIGNPGGTGAGAGGRGGAGGASGSGGGGPSIGIAHVSGTITRTGGSVHLGAGGAGVPAQTSGSVTIGASVAGLVIADYGF